LASVHIAREEQEQELQRRRGHGAI
jgi:hypothetical protein